MQVDRDMELIPIHSERMKGKFKLIPQLSRMLKRAGIMFQNGDILAISGKFVAMSQGRFTKLSEICTLKGANEIAERYSISPSLAELVAREADYTLQGLKGFLLTVKNGAFSPNAGIDKSNIMKGYAILHPSEPSRVARMIRDWAYLEFSSLVGVVITDSRLQPLRMGTVGIAIGASGLPSVIDDRGRRDLFGNVMRVTRRAIADDIASAAQLLMGETDESVPLVVVRGSGINVSFDYDGLDVTIPPSQCIYVKGLSAMKIS
ncbi:MAG: coenzyme F420-0:L-glutamate ligase [Conexivisphaerales archaeon]